MPYISKERRRLYDDNLSDLISTLNGSGKKAGDICYIITRIIDGTLGKDFTEMATAIGILGATKEEYYRRIVAGYEDEKASMYGDVYRKRPHQSR